MRLKIDPMKKVAKRKRKHRALFLKWFKADGQYSNGIVEGFNNKEKLTMRKEYDFESFHAIEIALYHTQGAVPVTKTDHRLFLTGQYLTISKINYSSQNADRHSGL